MKHNLRTLCCYCRFVLLLVLCLTTINNAISTSSAFQQTPTRTPPNFRKSLHQHYLKRSHPTRTKAQSVSSLFQSQRGVFYGEGNPSNPGWRSSLSYSSSFFSFSFYFLLHFSFSMFFFLQVGESGVSRD